MTDRELIELAAKAAGIIVWRGNGFQDDTYFTDAKTESGVVVGAEWNPLTSDADAFRLAVRLEISVSQFHSSVTAGAMLPVRAMVERVSLSSERPAATRRAITMAAAEIAKERFK